MHSIWFFVQMQYFPEFLKMHIKWSTFAKFSHLISLYIHPWMPLIWGPPPSSHSQPDIPWDSQTRILLLFSEYWIFVFDMFVSYFQYWIFLFDMFIFRWRSLALLFSSTYIAVFAAAFSSCICICNQNFLHSPLPRGDFAHAGVKFTEVSSYSGSQQFWWWN